MPGAAGDSARLMPLCRTPAARGRCTARRWRPGHAFPRKIRPRGVGGGLRRKEWGRGLGRWGGGVERVGRSGGEDGGAGGGGEGSKGELPAGRGGGGGKAEAGPRTVSSSAASGGGATRLRATQAGCRPGPPAAFRQEAPASHPPIQCNELQLGTLN